MRLEILLTAVLFFGGTCCSGYLLQRILHLHREGILFSMAAGTVLWWAIMELILVPMTMKHASFELFARSYSFVILALTLGGLLSFKEMLEDVKALPGQIRKHLTLGHIIAFLLICYQLYFIHHHMYLEWDDTYYVNLANEAIWSDKIYWVYPETGAFADFDKRYVLSLWPIFYAWLSRVIGVMPTIMAHTILPWLTIPLAYMVYHLIGKKLFPEDVQMQGMFLAMAVLLHLFMSGEHTSGLTFLSITPWVGKGVLASILIPMLFYCILRTAQEDRWANWLLLGITCLGGCLLSSMGIMLTPVFVGTTVALLAVRKKNIRYLMSGVAACLPCIILGIYYIYLTH
jgi:hypothetical protein